METTPTPFFHEKSFLFMKQKASYNRVGTFILYPFYALFPCFFYFGQTEVSDKVNASEVIIFILPLYVVCLGLMTYWAYKYGHLLQTQAKNLDNHFNAVVDFIFRFQQYENRIRIVFTVAFVILLLFAFFERISNQFVIVYIIMIVMLAYQNNLTKINEWKKSLKA